MMKRILANILMGLIAVSCGYHQQKSQVIEPPEKFVSGEETDPTLLLINAVEAGDVEAVAKALAEGGDPNTKTNGGLTLLMIAVRAQRFAVVDLLLQNNADVEMRTKIEGNEEEKSALDFVGGGEGTRAILEALLRGEEILPAKANQPLMDAVEELNRDNVRWLLFKGADPNYIHNKKTTPLIALFSLRGVEGQRFDLLVGVFDELVSHPQIDVNLKVRRNYPLKRAQDRAEDNPAYLTLVDRLIALGAK